MKRIWISIFILLLFIKVIIYAGVSKNDLKYVMPSADSFLKNKGDLPHYKAYKKKKLIGICYVSTDVVPEIIGYNGPIKILIGLYNTGKISGIKILEHVENIKQAEVIVENSFHDQFKSRSIKDSFVVGKDVDNVTGATVTIERVCEIVKNSSLIMYLYYFPKEDAGSGMQKKILDLKNKHLIRLAKIDRIENIGLEKINQELWQKAERLRELEQKVYLKKLKKIWGIESIGVDNAKEETIKLNPKWGIQKVNEKLIREQIKSGNLSKKEADHYTK